jgi:hypothetical protein
MTRKAILKVVSSAKTAKSSTSTSSPRPLGKHGKVLWDAVMSEYRIDDIGGVEILAQACAALDRAEQCAAEVNRDGYDRDQERPSGASGIKG